MHSQFVTKFGVSPQKMLWSRPSLLTEKKKKKREVEQAAEIWMSELDQKPLRWLATTFLSPTSKKGEKQLSPNKNEGKNNGPQKTLQNLDPPLEAFSLVGCTCCAHSKKFEEGLRSCLDYGKEVQWSRILGEWGNMIGHQMGSSSVGVYNMVETSLVEDFKHGVKMMWLWIWQHSFFLLGEFFRGQVSW